MQDLEYLKQQSNPGPFTSTEQVKTFMEQIPEFKEKNQQMHIEVRFQKSTSKFLKKDNAIFHLKRDGKNFPTSDNVLNLCLYFDQLRCVSSLSMGDLRNV